MKAPCHALLIVGPNGPAVNLRYLDRVHIIAVTSKPVKLYFQFKLQELYWVGFGNPQFDYSGVFHPFAWPC